MVAFLDSVGGALAGMGRVVVAYRYEIATVLVGFGAAAVIATVLRRLESGGSRQVGRWIAWLCALLIATVGFAFRAFGNADASYSAAFLVLAAGGSIWIAQRSAGSVSPAQTARPSTLLLTVCGVLLGTLWIVQKAVEGLDIAQQIAALPPDAADAPVLSVTQFIGVLGGAGVLAMAIVQGLRTLLPVRGVFHRAVVERWIDESLNPKASEAATLDDKRVAITKRMLAAITRLARGSAAGERYALLDLPIEQLCGQIAAGADRLLDDPTSLPPDLSGSSKDVQDQGKDSSAPQSPQANEALQVLSVLAAGESDVQRFLDLAPKIAAARKTEVESPESREYVRLRANLSQRIQRNIDRLQIETSFWWKRALRGLAFTICGVLGLSIFERGIPAAVCAVVGGFVATATRDLIAVVEKARR